MTKSLEKIIRQQISQDPGYFSLPRRVLELVVDTASMMPIILHQHLALPVTAESFLRAKLTFLEYLVESHYLTQLSRVLTAQLGNIAPMFVVKANEDAIDTALGLYQDRLKTVLQKKASGRHSPAPLLLEQFAFNETVHGLILKGHLTFGELLALQPAAIFNWL